MQAHNLLVPLGSFSFCTVLIPALFQVGCHIVACTMAKKFTGVEGSTVPLKDTIQSFDAIAKGEFDHVAEQAFFNVGSIEDVEEKWAGIQKENG